MCVCYDSTFSNGVCGRGAQSIVGVKGSYSHATPGTVTRTQKGNGWHCWTVDKSQFKKHSKCCYHLLLRYYCYHNHYFLSSCLKVGVWCIGQCLASVFKVLLLKDIYLILRIFCSLTRVSHIRLCWLADIWCKLNVCRKRQKQLLTTLHYRNPILYRNLFKTCITQNESN